MILSEIVQERQQEYRTKNAKLLDLLREENFDLTLPHQMHHVFYVYTEADVPILEVMIRLLGWQIMDVSRRQDEDDGTVFWQIVGALVTLPTEHDLNELTDTACEVIVCAHTDGEYDGYDLAPFDLVEEDDKDEFEALASEEDDDDESALPF